MPAKPYIVVPGGQYQCVGPNSLEGEKFQPGVTVDIVRKSQGDPDASYQATADSSGQFLIPVELPSPGAITFIASVAGSNVDRTKVTAQTC